MKVGNNETRRREMSRTEMMDLMGELDATSRTIREWEKDGDGFGGVGLAELRGRKAQILRLLDAAESAAEASKG
jgi:hypothetical protein